eukprot:s3899_g4.t1
MATFADDDRILLTLEEERALLPGDPLPCGELPLPCQRQASDVDDDDDDAEEAGDDDGDHASHGEEGDYDDASIIITNKSRRPGQALTTPALTRAKRGGSPNKGFSTCWIYASQMQSRPCLRHDVLQGTLLSFGSFIAGVIAAILPAIALWPQQHERYHQPSFPGGRSVLRFADSTRPRA